MDNSGSKYYYSCLNEEEKAIYDQITKALLNFEPELSIPASCGRGFPLDLSHLMMAVLLDNPVFFYLNRNRVISRQSPWELRIIFQYTCERQEAKSLWEAVEQEIRQFVDTRIEPQMSTLAKQLELHKYMKQIKYSHPPYNQECFSVIGALLNRKCVCEGYAKAYKLLCDRLGIASIVVTGEAFRPDGKKEAHAWNITRIDGVTAHIDTAWDSKFGNASYDYFNLCDREISADHIFQHERYPKCEPNNINYFYKNGLIAANEAELRRIVQDKSEEPYFSVKLLFPFSMERVCGLPFHGGQFRYNAAQNIISFSRAVLE